jgi:hypothetical protein
MISISKLPAGNPVAYAHPDKYAMSYAKCSDCNVYYCDTCYMTFDLICPQCGRQLSAQGFFKEQLASLQEEYQIRNTCRIPFSLDPVEIQHVVVPVWVVILISSFLALSFALSGYPAFSRFGWISLKILGMAFILSIVPLMIQDFLRNHLDFSYNTKKKIIKQLRKTRVRLIALLSGLLASPVVIYLWLHNQVGSPWLIAFIYVALIGILVGFILGLIEYAQNLKITGLYSEKRE